MKKISLIIFALFISLITAGDVNAHVRYLVEEEKVNKYSGQDYSFLFEPLKDFHNIALILWTIAGLIIILLLSTQIKFFNSKLKNIGERANGYSIFTPWMLRLSLGIALIGSGTAHTLVSPVLSGFYSFSTIQILIGFLIMAGFLVIPASISAVGIYIFAITQDFYIFGNLDFLATALALIVLDNEKPGLDDLIGLPKISPLRFLQKYVPLILRIGIGVAMMYLALYEKIFNPHLSEIIALDFGLTNVVPVSAAMWVFSAGIIEFIIGLALFLGIFTRLSSAIAFIVLSLSFFYFGEDVSSHITLFGILAVLFITQGGALSIDKKLHKKNPDFI